MDAKNLTLTQDNQLLVDVIDVITVSSAAFFISITLVTISAMAERCLFMSRRSFMTTHRRNFIAVAIFLFSFPSIIIYFFGSRRIFRMMLMAEISLCYLVTSLAYFKVYRIIRRHQFQVQSSGISQNLGHSSVDLAKYKKSVAFMLCIMFFFSICFIPYVVCNAIIFTERTNWRLTIIARNSSAVLIFLSSLLNPGLFLWRMQEIRTSLKQLFSN